MESKPNLDNLLHLLKCSSKKKVVSLCNEVIFNLNITNKKTLMNTIKSVLDLNDSEATDFYLSLEQLLRHSVYNGYNEVESVKSYFPSDFHSNLSDLLAGIIVENYPKWRSTVLSDQVSLPKLVDFEWKLENENTAHPPKCVVQLKTSEGKSKEVTFSKEALDTLLDSLSELREQISSISQS